MTLEHIAILIAAHIIVLIIVWAPPLDFIGPCVRFLQRRRNSARSRKVTSPAVSALAVQLKTKIAKSRPDTVSVTVTNRAEEI